MVMHSCNPNTLEAEARGSWICGYPDFTVRHCQKEKEEGRKKNKKEDN